MGKITKILLVILYLAQVEIAFHTQILNLYHHALDAIRPSEVTQQIVGNLFWRPVHEVPPGTTSTLQPAMSLAEVPAALTTLVGEIEVMHPTEEGGHHDKDRIKRHRKLHRFRQRQHCFGNLAKSLRRRRPAPGHDFAYVTTAVPHLVFNGEN